jgi:hypothetical protein
MMSSWGVSLDKNVGPAKAPYRRNGPLERQLHCRRDV